jgi:hypothetical protein
MSFDKAKTAMTNVEFDAFGEPMLKSQALPTEPQGRLSRGLVRAGTGIFWALVVAIVAARVVWFQPGFGDQIADLSSRALFALTALFA